MKQNSHRSPGPRRAPRTKESAQDRGERRAQEDASEAAQVDTSRPDRGGQGSQKHAARQS